MSIEKLDDNTVEVTGDAPVNKYDKSYLERKNEISQNIINKEQAKIDKYDSYLEVLKD